MIRVLIFSLMYYPTRWSPSPVDQDVKILAQSQLLYKKHTIEPRSKYLWTNLEDYASFVRTFNLHCQV